MEEYDSPWKEALDLLLEPFIEFFFPDIHPRIDWSRGYEALDAELEQIIKEAEFGKRLADKLYRVWTMEGTEVWVLIHIEIQAQRDDSLPQRMFVYHYRIFDLHHKPIANLALLADEQGHWRPTEYRHELWGSELSLVFRTAKLLDWQGRDDELEQMPNPLGLIVLAHLKTRATRRDSGARRTGSSASSAACTNAAMMRSACATSTG